jgi:hypothetical protein
MVNGEAAIEIDFLEVVVLEGKNSKRVLNPMPSSCTKTPAT